MKDDTRKRREEALAAALTDPELCEHMHKSYKEQKKILLEHLKILNAEIEKLEAAEVDYRHKYGNTD